MKRWVKLFSLSLVLLLAVSLVGCGQKQASSPNAGGSTPTPKPKYTVALEASFAPFEYRDSKTGELTGFDVELIKAIGEVAGFDIEFKEMGFDSIVAAVQSGSVDMAISGISIDPERSKMVNFSLPYYQSVLAVAVRADNNTIKGFDDLKGKKIAAQIATTGAKTAKQIPGTTVKELNTIADLFLELKNGGVDAVVNDLPVTAWYIQQSQDQNVKIVGDVHSAEYYGIAIPKSKPDQLEKVNNALKTLKENGKFAELYKKWFGQDPPSFLPGEPPAKQ